jgi:hypothetical protein
MRMLTGLVATAAAVITFAAVVPASAQDVDLAAHVPFEFKVGKTSLPRDAYQLSRLNGHADVLLVRGARKTVLIRGEQLGRQSGEENPSLVFHRYGDQYFLREIRFAGRTRVDLPETKEERDAAEGRADRASATLETVVVPAGR